MLRPKPDRIEIKSNQFGELINHGGALTNGDCAFTAEALWGLCALLPYEDRVRKCDLGEHICSELQFERFSP